ncbi:hypothetical protein MUO79_02215 [Candidatus Bathyarchaeota archaeon]|nr:hypothetical protein [Candidatus Bathyarchaeota archaeon]
MPKVRLDDAPEKKSRIARKGLDLDHLNIVPKEEIPPKSRVSNPYKELLRRIPKGKAVVLTPHDVSLDTAAAAIRRLQKLPEFRDFTATRRTVDGQTRLFIIHEDIEEI